MAQRLHDERAHTERVDAVVDPPVPRVVDRSARCGQPPGRDVAAQAILDVAAVTRHGPSVVLPPRLRNRSRRQALRGSLVQHHGIRAGESGRVPPWREGVSELATTVTTSVLFTDLVGSTELAVRLGWDVAEELRLVHFGLLRTAVDECGGTEVKNLGDGLMVVYPSVTAALASAVRIQQALEVHNRTAATPLSVRVGIAHGEANADEGDYYGEPVIEASRLCARADGGQIVATDIVRLLARRSEHEFGPVEQVTLKGLPGAGRRGGGALAPPPRRPPAAAPQPTGRTPRRGAGGARRGTGAPRPAPEGRGVRRRAPGRPALRRAGHREDHAGQQHRAARPRRRGDRPVRPLRRRALGALPAVRRGAGRALRQRARGHRRVRRSASAGGAGPAAAADPPSAPRPAGHPLDGLRGRPVPAARTRSAQCSRTSRSAPRWCSCSTTCTGPTSRRCSCSATSSRPCPLRGCSCSAPTGSPT